MKNKYYILLLFCLIFPFEGWARPIDTKKALEIAQKFLTKDVPFTRSNASNLKLIYPAEEAITRTNSSPQYYVFGINEEKGFLIVAGDDEATPIAGYSYNSVFDYEHASPAFKYWLSEYARYIDDVRAGVAIPAKADFSENQTRSSVSVEPLLDIKWDQGYPYNALCPAKNNNPDENMPTGCVATAMAQIMRYHKWPAKGKGSITYGGWPERSMDFSQSVYDWNNMINTYSLEWNPDTEQYVERFNEIEKQAVAKLMVDCGYAVKMNYGENESGAFSPCVSAALVDYFSYSPSVKTYARESYSTSTWIELIRGDLQKGQPVYYSGSSITNAGHAFVCDGIDSNNFLHINWGWGGYSDGYFDMNYMNPSGLGTGGGSGSYFLNQQIILNIAPITPEEENTKVTPVLSLLGKIDIADGYRVAKSEFRGRELGVTQIHNLTGRVYEGSMCLGLYKNGELIDCMGERSVNLKESSYYPSVNMRPPLPAEGETGEYELMLICKEEGEEEYHLLDIGETNGRINLTVTDTEYIFNYSGLTEADLSFVSFSASSTIYTGLEVEIKCTIKNNGKKSQLGNLGLYLVPKSEENNVEIDENAVRPTFGWTIYGESVQTIATSVVLWNNPGEYRLYLVYKKDGYSEYQFVNEESPKYVTIKKVPTYPIITLNRSFGLYQEAYEQHAEVWIGGYVSVSSNKNAPNTEIILCARKKNDPNAEEIVLLTTHKDITPGGSSFAVTGYTTRLPFMEPGIYTAYLKYNTGEEYVLIEPDSNNSADFELKATTYPLLYLVEAPLFKSGGNVVERSESATATVTLKSSADYVGKAYLYAYDYTLSEWLLSSNTVDFDLKAGVPKAIEFSYRCNENATLGSHTSLKVSYYVGDVVYSAVAFSDELLTLTVTEFTDIPQTATGVKLITTPNGFLVKGTTAGSSISVTEVSGKLIYRGVTSDVETNIPLNGISKGTLYLIRIGGIQSAITLKAVYK